MNKNRRKNKKRRISFKLRIATRQSINDKNARRWGRQVGANGEWTMHFSRSRVLWTVQTTIDTQTYNENALMSYGLGCADTKHYLRYTFCCCSVYTFIMKYEFDLFKTTLNWNMLLLVVLRFHVLCIYFFHAWRLLSLIPIQHLNNINFQFGVIFWTPLVMPLPSKATNRSRSSGILCWSLPCNEWQNFFVLLQSSFSDKLNIENDGSPVASLTIFKKFGKQFRSLSPSSEEYVSNNIKPLHLQKRKEKRVLQYRLKFEVDSSLPWMTGFFVNV